MSVAVDFQSGKFVKFLVAMVRKEWRNLRDRFTAYRHKNLPSGSAPENHPSYALFASM